MLCYTYILFLLSESRRMSSYGKYADRRVYQHFVHTYSRVPYLDREIFNLSVRGEKNASLAEGRASSAKEGLARISAISDQLEKSLKSSRERRERESLQFAKNMQASHASNLQREKLLWSKGQEMKTARKEEYDKDKKYLQDLLKTTATKAESRRASYRRWN